MNDPLFLVCLWVVIIGGFTLVALGFALGRATKAHDEAGDEADDEETETK